MSEQDDNRFKVGDAVRPATQRDMYPDYDLDPDPDDPRETHEGWVGIVIDTGRKAHGLGRHHGGHYCLVKFFDGFEAGWWHTDLQPVEATDGQA